MLRMRIYCTACGKKALITKRHKLTTEFAKIYCVCPDPECAHSFAMDLTFSHTLKPSGKDLEQLMLESFCAMSGAKQQDFFSQLSRQTGGHNSVPG